MTRESEPRGHSHRGTALAVAPLDLPALGAFDDASAQQGDDDSFHLRDLLRIFLKHKWTILAIVTASALFSIVTTYLATQVYRATTTVQIERFTPPILDFKEVTPGESGDYWSDPADFYATNPVHALHAPRSSSFCPTAGLALLLLSVVAPRAPPGASPTGATRRARPAGRGDPRRPPQAALGHPGALPIRPSLTRTGGIGLRGRCRFIRYEMFPGSPSTHRRSASPRFRVAWIDRPQLRRPRPSGTNA